MTTTEYKRYLIEYFKGTPTEDSYAVMAAIVSDWTDGEAIEQYDLVQRLHTAVFGPPWKCAVCEQHDNYFEQCSSCDSPRPATDAELDQMRWETP